MDEATVQGDELAQAIAHRHHLASAASAAAVEATAFLDTLPATFRKELEALQEYQRERRVAMEAALLRHKKAAAHYTAVADELETRAALQLTEGAGGGSAARLAEPPLWHEDARGTIVLQ